MNLERNDERAAKMILETALGIKLEHADKYGGVDYVTSDGTDAVEVTRITDGRKRAGRGAAARSRDAGSLEGELQTCWIAFAPDTQPGLKSIVQKVHPAIVHLEKAGETAFGRQPAMIHVAQRGPLADIYRQLLEAGIERASAVPNHGHRSHTHHVWVSLGSGGTSSGSNAAVELLVAELSSREDNHVKLMQSGAPNRHLFVWLDDDTRFDISRPLSRDAPPWKVDRFGMLTLQPALNPAVTQLWVMHQGSRNGWRWDGERWSELSTP